MPQAGRPDDHGQQRQPAPTCARCRPGVTDMRLTFWTWRKGPTCRTAPDRLASKHREPAGAFRGRCRRMAVRPADWSDRTAIDPGGRRSTLPRCRTELLAADTLQQRIQPTLAPLIARRGRWPRNVVPKPTIGTRAPKMPCNPSARRICLSVAHRRDFRSVIVARSIVPASWEPI